MPLSTRSRFAVLATTLVTLALGTSVALALGGAVEPTYAGPATAEPPTAALADARAGTPARSDVSGRLATAPAPLAGLTIVIDPGHQLGNANHPREINRLVDAGGFKKACNTTGTSTNGGYAEATFVFRVAARVRQRLRDLGARVVMTRYRNSRDLWGPCIDVRGKLGNKTFRGWDRAADLKVSIHGDGSSSANRGFHVIVATKAGRRAASTAYAKATRAALVRAGFPRSNYIGGGTALSFRGDLGTLNLSRIPTIMLELGNMRNAKDAAAMTSRTGRRHYAMAVVKGIRHHLDR